MEDDKERENKMTNYYDSLPTKRMAAGALLFNAAGELLIVKPTYKNHWSIPGGVVDKDESPRAACRREVKEEIGLDDRKRRITFSILLFKF